MRLKTLRYWLDARNPLRLPNVFPEFDICEPGDAGLVRDGRPAMSPLRAASRPRCGTGSARC